MTERIATIGIEKMRFHPKIGCFEQERTDGVLLEVDFSGQIDISAAAVSDNLQDTIDVNRVYTAIEKEMELPCNLLESLSQRIMNAIEVAFPEFEAFDVTIRKIHPMPEREVSSWSIKRTWSKV